MFPKHLYENITQPLMIVRTLIPFHTPCTHTLYTTYYASFLGFKGISIEMHFVWLKIHAVGKLNKN